MRRKASKGDPYQQVAADVEVLLESSDMENVYPLGSQSNSTDVGQCGTLGHMCGIRS